ncbi:MAG TPA: hypothetical protein VKB84_15935 [Candidatus Binataceae bacterium]|nr:hypothetical protein [Candidatus Binataceae bacterium]
MKQAIFTIFAVAAAAIVAGCASGPGGANSPGANSAVTSSAGQQQTSPPADSPYSQPLMATGGDMVMLDVTSGGIAA